MKYVVLAVTAIILSMAAASFTLGHKDRQEAQRLQGELTQLRAKNTHLAGRNKALKRRVVALRDDPRLAERRARESGKLSRPDELVFQFESTAPTQTVDVGLTVEHDSLKLAGRTIEMNQLDATLMQLKGRLGRVHLNTTWAKDLDPVRRQRVVESLERAGLAPPSDNP